MARGGLIDLPSLVFRGLALLALSCLLPFFNCQLALCQEKDDGAKQPAAISAVRLGQDEARKYLVSLINRDRASAGLRPVELDEVGSAAGQSHTDEMATVGYISHWGLDGRKPVQRYSEGGGADEDGENAHLGAMDEDSKSPARVPLMSTPTYLKSDLDDIESGMFNEKPPMDGHRKNILEPQHNRVGIALSASGTEDAGRVACTQEFIDHYGDYTPIPSSLKMGQTITVAGTLQKGVHLYTVELKREDLPTPMTIKELNATYAYTEPGESVANYWLPPFQSPVPITMDTKDGCEVFSVEVSLPKKRKGLYYVRIWAKFGEKGEQHPISTRTVVVAN